ncbi:hypothetical protein SAMN05216266_10917 [Amycolatopsis marina]|uniref:PPE family protein n=1 Tax=Amycolatopsis marina TaxID=490629 RepID=A0A1I1ACY9_9PSEU|nr:hypothetical protein [Amycolatopsis marina]SFB35871.1 hypothetical protein SAMN05216266_10917 [Amycolatopsis marina]
MEYATLSVAAQFGLVSAEVHHHLPRVQDAARMWRAVAEQLRDVSDSMRRELDSLATHWNDSTGAGFVVEVERRRAAIDELLARIEDREPWRALDDLARQLLVTKARLADALERSVLVQVWSDAQAWHAVGTDGPGQARQDAGLHREGAAYLAELDRYFDAAAEAVHGCSGGARRAVPPAGAPEHPHATTSTAPAAGCCSDVALPAGPALAGLPGAFPAPFVGPGPVTGAALPPGGVSIPGLIAIPPGASGAGGKPGSRAEPAAAGPGSSWQPGAGGGIGSSGVPGGAGTGADAAAGPPRIEQAAKPVASTTPPTVPEAPRLPESSAGSIPGSSGGGGRMMPPMMMMPPGAGAASGSGRSGAARPVGGNERRTRSPQPTPGVPARLRGRSGLADPTANGFRPLAMSSRTSGAGNSGAPGVLDHEVWQVDESVAASPLRPERPERPERVRRAGNRGF